MAATKCNDLQDGWRASARDGALLLVLLGAACPAGAVSDCSISTTGVAFGVYDTYATAPDDSTGTVTIACNYLGGKADQLSFSVALSTGTSGNYAQRRLQAGSQLLRYNLYSDLARTKVWGDGSAGTTVASGTFTLGPGVGNGRRELALPVYGRIAARQDVLSGNYADAILVTLVF
jgi:spore coat protein U-like protein